MIEVQHLTKRYGNRLAVDDVSFKIRNGKIYGLLGPNGAGKSTTMNMIAGCLAPTEGVALINGYDVCDRPMEAKRQIGYLPEIPPLFGDMTPAEYLRFVTEAKRVPDEQAERQMAEVMAVTGLAGVQNRLIRNLSKGYKQRVGIAQAMLGNPDIIILDEPTVGLDPRQMMEIRDLVHKLGEKKTVLISSHILSEISAICDHVIILSGGRVVADEDMAALERSVEPTAALNLTVKGDEAGVRAVLAEIPGVLSVDCLASEAEGEIRLTVRTDKEKDLRDDIFFAMAGKRYAVVSMEKREVSLEEVFLRLTAGHAEGAGQEEKNV